MLGNFIGGGQVFMHKLHMFRQVFKIVILCSMLIGLIVAFYIKGERLSDNNWSGAMTYVSARIAMMTQGVIDALATKPKLATVDAYYNGKLWKKNMRASYVISSNRFNKAYDKTYEVFLEYIKSSMIFTLISSILIFLIWNKFGNTLKSEKKKEGSGVILDDTEVASKLNAAKLASDLKIGKMPLVKDMETRHFLVTGSTGSGKTNLMHSLLLQIERMNHPALVMDQTGEMVAKYYNADRGDIIFNPFDERTGNWDFWNDCRTQEQIQSFAKILMSFSRKSSGARIDTFWESSAETVFISCCEYLKNNANESMEELLTMIYRDSKEALQSKLQNTDAARYFGDNAGSKGKAESDLALNSILSVLGTNSKPLTYLRNIDKDSKLFSLNEYFKAVKSGSKAWLFLTTKPSARALTLPLMSCVIDLALSKLIDIGIDKNRRLWTIIDELPALGNLPALNTLMSEGRKYGACVVAGMQSLNQLYEIYGHYAGSTIFGQFGTYFFFRNTEPTIAKMISSMSGSETIVRHQKNISFGANTYRDGVSYNEQERKKSLIEASDLAKLNLGECYVLLPNIKKERLLAKIQTEEIILPNKHEGFVEKQKNEEKIN